jgi:hypothetical protein
MPAGPVITLIVLNASCKPRSIQIQTARPLASRELTEPTHDRACSSYKNTKITIPVRSKLPLTPSNTTLVNGLKIIKNGQHHHE